MIIDSLSRLGLPKELRTRLKYSEAMIERMITKFNDGEKKQNRVSDTPPFIIRLISLEPLGHLLTSMGQAVATWAPVCLLTVLLSFSVSRMLRR